MIRHQKRKLSVLLMILLAMVLIAGCDQSGPEATPTSVPVQPPVQSSGEIVVFAASSLKDAFDQIASDAKQSGIKKVTFNYAGSQALVTQLSQGAKADLLATADEKSMKAALDAGVIGISTYRTFASNKLIVITAKGSEGKIATLKDLSKSGLKLVLAAPAVPAGNYSLQILDKMAADPAYGTNFKDAVLANVVSREDNVRQVVAKVQLGEADAGIVYVTDAKSVSGKVGTIEIPEQYNVIAEYWLAVPPNALNVADARTFVGYLLSDQGQKTLQDFGFAPPLKK